MKQTLVLLSILINLVCYGQYGIRVYVEKPNLFYKQTGILLNDSTNDGYDQCCDAVRLGQSPDGIWTEINGTQYAINSYSGFEDYEDKIIPLYTSAFHDTGISIIGVDWQLNDLLTYRLLDSESPGIHFLPYICEGPITGQRFSLYLEYPLHVEVNNSCDFGYVVVENDIPETIYYLINDSNQVSYLPNYTDTIFDLPSGNYTLCVYGDMAETIQFSISNTVINANLYIPQTVVYIGDSYVTPILNIYSQYTNIMWDFGDGTIVYNDINPIHYYVEPGEYTLKAIVSEGQCSKAFEGIIRVEGSLGIQTINKPQYRHVNSYLYNIDGKLVKKL